LAATPSAVKAAYDLANSYKGTVTGVKINGTTKSPSSGVVDLGTVITSHQDISGKQDKLVSGTNIKTINGTSILGSGNITISGGSGGSSSGSGAYPEVDGSIYKDEQFLGNYYFVDESMPLMPNTFYVFPECGVLDIIAFGAGTIGVANEYLFQFTSGSEPTSLRLPDAIKWANDSAPTIQPNKIYQISILNGLGSVMEFSNEAPSVPIVFYVNDNPYNAMSNMTWIDFINSDYNPDIYNDKMFIEGGYGNPKYAKDIYSEDDIEYYAIYTEGYGEVLLTDKILSITYITEL
jgi:hypothetical protein